MGIIKKDSSLLLGLPLRGQFGLEKIWDYNENVSQIVTCYNPLGAAVKAPLDKFSTIEGHLLSPTVNIQKMSQRIILIQS